MLTRIVAPNESHYRQGALRNTILLHQNDGTEQKNESGCSFSKIGLSSAGRCLGTKGKKEETKQSIKKEINRKMFLL